ncbi:ECF transporter S component [Enterococcus xiangfangensis]|uniref:ECF transporter S component n=1 Tax=Enterococcus xiangfangensis TaxID=1296537 RepID=A0ABU3F9I9_9ENTE|nr:ECF transporter S component [Enterococcus xiangfangensis]MDT2759342.1 ECF transporter S component [Enterococcus xiangfangensis]
MSQSDPDFLTQFYQDENYQKKLSKKTEYQPSMNVWNQKTESNKLSRRTRLSLLVNVLLFPLVIYYGIKSGNRSYLKISLLMIGLATAPFLLIFEGRKPQARELIIIAVLIGLGVAGRGAFFMFPQFKPVAALVIISAVSFGPEVGFLVGSGTALVSNIFFSQGPWTPWQMFAFGMIGFIAGIFYRWGLLRANRLSLCIFGFFSIFLIYGLIMNPASLLMFTPLISKEALITVFISGAPMDLIHAISTVIFLAILARPLLEKLQRIKIKYGLI